MLDIQALFPYVQRLFFIFVGVVGVSFVIGFHELGHFLFCKLFGVHTPSFSIGFGPRILQKKIGDTNFVLSAIPLGGYVEIAGAQEVGQGEQSEAHRNDESSFASKPYYQKMAVIFGGILFNLIFTYVVLASLFSLGIPKTPLLYPGNSLPIIQKISPDSPAAKAGLQEGDKVQALDGVALHDSTQKLLEIVRAHPHETMKFSVLRHAEPQEVSVELGTQPFCGKQIGLLGATFEINDIPAQGWSEGIKSSIKQTHEWVKKTFQVFAGLFKQKTLDGVGGPLAVLTQSVKGVESGPKVFLLLLAFISVNLAVLNVIPLPIFDGGQALFYTIEAIIGRPLPESVRMGIHYVCWFSLLALMIYLTYCDLGAIIKSFIK